MVMFHLASEQPQLGRHWLTFVALAFLIRRSQIRLILRTGRCLIHLQSRRDKCDKEKLT